MAEPPKSDKKAPLVSVARYSEIGFIIPAAVLVGLLLPEMLANNIRQRHLTQVAAGGEFSLAVHTVP